MRYPDEAVKRSARERVLTAISKDYPLRPRIARWQGGKDRMVESLFIEKSDSQSMASTWMTDRAHICLVLRM